jgi:ribosomal protein S18 acetylase RimI-like enzyme
MSLTAARLTDIPFIRRIAGHPDNAGFVTDEDDADLARYFDDPTARVLVWTDGDQRGFAIFCDLDSRAGSICLMRLALETPGRGGGAAFLDALVDHGFGALGAARLWLDASGGNVRAQKAYLRAGFVLEGRLRCHEYVPRTGQIIDTCLYGMLRTEWHQLRRTGGGLASPGGGA